jgi:hypothetical protein
MYKSDLNAQRHGKTMMISPRHTGGIALLMSHGVVLGENEGKKS